MVLRRWSASAPLLLALSCAHEPAAAEQTTAQTTPAPQNFAAASGDVSSPEQILAATYDVISGAAGQARNWARFRSLFLPGARLIPTRRNEGGSGATARVLTPDDYVARASPLFEKEGFFEKESARRMERYGNIVQVFSTYESRHSPNEAPFARGINSFQLFFDGTRWWVVTILWQAETAEAPIPKEFLPGAQ